MAPTNIMVAGSTPGQDVGERVGNLLWWGGVLAGITALCVALVWATHEGRVARPLGGHRWVPRREPRNPWMEKIRQTMERVGAWLVKITGPPTRRSREEGRRRTRYTEGRDEPRRGNPSGEQDTRIGTQKHRFTRTEGDYTLRLPVWIVGPPSPCTWTTSSLRGWQTHAGT
jgi:hypothetical protein